MKLSEYIEKLIKHLEDCNSRGIDPEMYILVDNENGFYDPIESKPEKMFTKTEEISHFIDNAIYENEIESEGEKIEDYTEIVVIN